MINSKDSLFIKGSEVHLSKGQQVYVSVYSHIPYFTPGRVFELSSVLSIRNTEISHPITIVNVKFYDNDGNFIKDYIKEPLKLKPLASKDFLVPEKDKAGTGANFIVEWISDSLVTEPVLESVMVGTTGGQGISFVCQGKVIREVK